MQFSSCLVVISHVLFCRVLLHCTVKITLPGWYSAFLSALQGHHREVWCLTISPNGDHLVSSSHDKSLRLWERTREPIILEEEREMVRRTRSTQTIQQHTFVFCFFVCVSKQPCFRLDRSEKQSLRRAWLKGMSQWWALSFQLQGDIFMLFTRHYLWYRFELAACLNQSKNCSTVGLGGCKWCINLLYLQVPGETQGEAAPAGKKTIETVKAVSWLVAWVEFSFYWHLLDLARVLCVSGESSGENGIIWKLRLTFADGGS